MSESGHINHKVLTELGDLYNQVIEEVSFLVVCDQFKGQYDELPENASEEDYTIVFSDEPKENHRRKVAMFRKKDKYVYVGPYVGSVTATAGLFVKPKDMVYGMLNLAGFKPKEATDDQG